MDHRPIQVWDLPTRSFHWTLVAIVTLQYASAEFGWLEMDWHVKFGVFLLPVLSFRFVWGFIGSDSARFSTFLRGPRTLIAYLRGEQRITHTHNPLGGWATLIMLFWVLAIVITGIASSDDIDVTGPLAPLLAPDTVRTMTRWHHRLTEWLPWWIALHVLAVAIHEWRGERLVAAMFHGRRADATRAVRIAPKSRALAWFGLCLALVYGTLWILST